MENRVNNHDHFTAFQAYYRHDIKAYIKLTCGHCRGTLLHKHFFHYLSTWVSWLSSLILSLLLNKDRKQYINPVVLEAGFLTRVKKNSSHENKTKTGITKHLYQTNENKSTQKAQHSCPQINSLE